MNNYKNKYLKYKKKYLYLKNQLGGETTFTVDHSTRTSIDHYNCGPLTLRQLGLLDDRQLELIGSRCNPSNPKKFFESGTSISILIKFIKRLNKVNNSTYIARKLDRENFTYYWNNYAKNILNPDMSNGMIMEIININRTSGHFFTLVNKNDEPYIIDNQNTDKDKHIFHFDENIDYFIDLWDSDVELYVIEDMYDKTYIEHIDGVTSTILVIDPENIENLIREPSIQFYNSLFKKNIQYDSGIDSMCISNDGTKIISGHRNGIINVYDIESNIIIKSIENDKEQRKTYSICETENKIISTSYTSIKQWDLEIGNNKSIYDNDIIVKSICLTSDKTMIIVGFDNGNIKIIELKTNIIISNLNKHVKSVNTICVTSDNTKIISGSDDNTIKIWNLNTGNYFQALITYNYLQTLKGHTNTVKSLCITTDNQKIISGSADKTIKIWALETGMLLKTLIGHESYVNTVYVINDNTFIISGSNDTTIKIWNLETGNCINTLDDIHTNMIKSICVTKDNKKIISGSLDHTICLTNMPILLLRKIRYTEFILFACITTDNTKVISSLFDNTIVISDLKTGHKLRTLVGHTDYLQSICITTDNKKIISLSIDHTIKIWDLESGECLDTLIEHTSAINTICITTDNKKIIYASTDNTIKIWDLETSTFLKTLNGHTLLVNSICVTTDNKKIISASDDKTIKIWDLETGVCLYTLTNNFINVFSICLSIDNTKIISGYENNSIIIWNLDTGDYLKTLTGHIGYIVSLYATTDNKKIISCSGDNTIKIWDLETGNCVNTLYEDITDPYCVSCENYIITRYNDSTFNVWWYSL